MSDYWKSLPRKFCDICKCWFADNKASIEFHEKGKKHKENVQKKITEIQKKGLKDFKKQKKLEHEMEKIERAALKAFQKDVAANPELAEQYKRSVVEEPMPQFMPTVEIQSKKKPSNKSKKSKSAKKNELSSKSSAEARIWYEGVSEEGHKYYWNSVTSESQWEPPKEGFISTEEQNSTISEAVSIEIKENSEDTSDTPSDTFGPIPRVDPYGQWTTIENEPEEEIDLQLPEKSKDIVDVYIPITKDSTAKIKEKTVGHLADYDGGECTFKKRKNLSSAKRNVRQRLDDT